MTNNRRQYGELLAVYEDQFLAGFASDLSYLNRYHPHALFEARWAAELGGQMHFSEESWKILKREEWFEEKSLSKPDNHLSGESRLKPRMIELLTIFVELDDKEAVLVCPVPEDHRLYHILVQNLEAFGGRIIRPQI